MKKLILLNLMLIATAVFAHPYDGFDYTLGADINGANGGTDWFLGWVTGGDVVVGEGLNYIDGQGIPLLTSGNSMEFRMSLLNMPSIPYAVRIPAVFYTSGKVYASYIWQHVSTSLGTDIYAGFMTTNWVEHGIDTEDLNTKFKLNGEDTAINKIIPDDTTFIVLMADLDSHTLSFWIDPDIESPGAADATVSATYEAPIDSFLFSQSNEIALGATNRYDEIRIGTTWAEVAPKALPEPAFFGLAFIALLGLIKSKK